MSSNNFKCPKTGKEFYISSYKSIQKSVGGWMYKDPQGYYLKNAENGELLVPIEKERVDDFETPMIFGSIQNRMDRNHKHFGNVAKKHSGSEEEKYKKDQRLKKEIDTVSGKSKL